MDLVQIWMLLVGVVVMLYVTLDGFTLGVGLLFPFSGEEHDRDVMMSSIAPIWDANQTWIVFGGVALFAAFPMIYTVLFSALYVPLLTFVFGLLFRGVAFEFRINAKNKVPWNRAFFAGCLVATLGQGLTLGAYLSGVQVEGTAFAGGAFDWLNPFSVIVALALVCGYMLLGATYLIIKTEGEVQDRAYHQAFWSSMAVLAFLIIVSVYSPAHDPQLLARWTSEPRVYFIWMLPLIGAAAFIALQVSLQRREEVKPFFFTVLLYLSAYLGLLAAIYPMAILPDITIYQAASQRETQIFILIGVLFLLPVILGYSIYSYWVFRGKVLAEEGYH